MQISGATFTNVRRDLNVYHGDVNYGSTHNVLINRSETSKEDLWTSPHLMLMHHLFQ